MSFFRQPPTPAAWIAFFDKHMAGTTLKHWRKNPLKISHISTAKVDRWRSMSRFIFLSQTNATVSISHRENGSRLGKSSTQVGGEGDCTGDVVVPRKGIDPLAKFESLLMAANETMRVPNPWLRSRRGCHKAEWQVSNPFYQIRTPK